MPMRGLIPTALVFTAVPLYAQGGAAVGAAAIPRTAEGRPDLQGIWQVRGRAAYDLQDHAASFGMPAGRSAVEGGVIPYQPWAAARRRQNFTQRAAADPLA